MSRSADAARQRQDLVSRVNPDELTLVSGST
jgi:hypothetical protein